MSVRLGRFIECRDVLPTTQFAHKKELGSSIALLYVSHTLQCALESRQEARIVHIYSVQLLTMSTIREFASSFALWVLEFFSIGVRMQWLIVVRANWQTRCLECLMAVF